MIDDQVSLIVIGVAAPVSLVTWIALIAVPAWRSYWRLRERVLALVMSVYVLAAFVLAGASGGRPGALVLRPALRCPSRFRSARGRRQSLTSMR